MKINIEIMRNLNILLYRLINLLKNNLKKVNKMIHQMCGARLLGWKRGRRRTDHNSRQSHVYWYPVQRCDIRYKRHSIRHLGISYNSKLRKSLLPETAIQVGQILRRNIWWSVAQGSSARLSGMCYFLFHWILINKRFSMIDITCVKVNFVII